MKLFLSKVYSLTWILLFLLPQISLANWDFPNDAIFYFEDTHHDHLGASISFIPAISGVDKESHPESHHDKHFSFEQFEAGSLRFKLTREEMSPTGDPEASTFSNVFHEFKIPQNTSPSLEQEHSDKPQHRTYRFNSPSIHNPNIWLKGTLHITVTTSHHLLVKHHHYKVYGTFRLFEENGNVNFIQMSNYGPDSISKWNPKISSDPSLEQNLSDEQFFEPVTQEEQNLPE